MTFAATIHGGHFVTLLADSGVKGDAAGEKPPRYSFFGQLETNDCVVVREEANKICRIGPQAVVTFAGRKQVGTRLVRFLRDSHCDGDLTCLRDPRCLVERVNPGDRADIAIAFVDGTQPRAVTWTTSDPDSVGDIRPRHAAIFGSGAQHFERPFRNVTTGGDPAWAEEHLPLVLSAALQAAATHVISTESCVSGMFVAATVSERGLTWLPDITFVIVESAEDLHATTWLVTCIIRDDVACMATRTPELQVLVGGETGRGAIAKLLIPPVGPIPSWMERHGPLVGSNTRNLQSEYSRSLARREGLHWWSLQIRIDACATLSSCLSWTLAVTRD